MNKSRVPQKQLIPKLLKQTFKINTNETNHTPFYISVSPYRMHSSGNTT